MKNTNALLAVTFSFLTFASVAKAQILVTDFNFQSYGTVSGGSTITDVLGSTTGTLSSVGTSLTSSGLANTTNTTNDGLTGVTLASGSLATFGSGAFTLQDWFTPYNGTPGNNVVGGTPWTGLWGGAASASSTTAPYIFGALYATPVSNGNAGGASIPLGSNMTNASLYDFVLTYNGAGLFTTYVNGVQTGTLTDAGFNAAGGLAAVTNFAVNGVADNPYNDDTQTLTTSDFLLFSGQLSSSSVSTLDGYGAGASLSEIANVAEVPVVPEPTAWVMMLCGFVVLISFQARRRVIEG